MRTAILPSVLLAMIAFGSGATVASADGAGDDTRSIVDRIVRTPSWHRGDPSLTEMGCALLRRPEKEVLAALEEALKRRLVNGSVAENHGAEIESLARLVVGSDRPEHGYLPFRVVVGVLIPERQGSFDGIGPGGPPAVGSLAELVKDPPRVRLRLSVNEKRILAFILEPDGDPTWSSDPGLARDLGRELGRAVAKDPKFSERLLERLKSRKRAKKLGPAKWTTGALMAAVAFGPTKGADAVLIEMVRGGWNDFEALFLLRDAGRFGVLDTYRDDLRLAGDKSALIDLRTYVGGEFILRPLLDAAKKSGHSAAAERVADAGHTMWRAQGELLKETLSFALELGTSEDEARRKAARRILNSLLWAGRAGTTTTNGYRARGIGGYPDPMGQGRRVERDLESGRIQLLPPGIHGPGIYSGHRDLRYLGRPRGGGRNPVFLSPKREGDEVVVTITNRLEESVCLNRTSFGYAAAEEFRSRVRHDGKTVEFAGVNLQIGAILTLVPSVCRREDYAVLAPGGSLTFRYPLAEGFPAEDRVRVSFRDWFVVPPNLPAPRVTWLLRADAP